MTELRVQAPAKINLTLEVLAKRSDGYHEVRTILQTIDLADTITLRPSDEISLSITGDADALADEPVGRNLAYRAALLLRGETTRGARIELEKNIPIAAGLGGGSNDAATVLRGLRQLWQIEASDDELGSMAAELGSDVPFFLHGGTAIAAGRGEQIEPLPDVAEQRFVVAWPPSPLTPGRAAARPYRITSAGAARSEHVGSENKTARMYAALRPEHYSDGTRTERLADRTRRGEVVRDEDVYNVFERVLGDVDATAARAFETARRLGTPHLCGSGPAFFFLAASDEQARAIEKELRALGLATSVTRTIRLARGVVDRGTAVVAEIFSGIVCGYALALIATPLAAVAMIRARVRSEWLRRILPEETPLLAWSLLLHAVWFFVFTAIGMVLGMLLYGVERRHPDGGFGSPNAIFTVIVIATCAIAVLPLAIVLPRWRTPLLATALVFTVTFGWIMPYLSLLGPA